MKQKYLLCLLFFPLLAGVLKFPYLSIAGDVMRLTAANLLSWSMYVLTEAARWIAYGLTVWALLRRSSPALPLALYGAGWLFSAACGLLGQRAFLTAEAFREELAFSLSELALNLGLDAVLCVLIVVLTKGCIARRSLQPGAARNPFSAQQANPALRIPAVLMLVNLLAWAVASTVVDLVSVGAPVNFVEVRYLAAPYLLLAANVLLGYLVMWRINRE